MGRISRQNRRLRLESVPNAMEQARVAAANLLGGDKSYAAIPWFWSDQYELKLQMVGFSTDADQEVLRGDPSSNQFARFYLENGVLVAADAVNSPKEFMLCKRLIGQQVDVAALVDHPNPILDRRLRLESVPNAMEQARVAAANMCGVEKNYASVPWFWSDQYELKLQMVGFSADGDTEIVRGDKNQNQFAVFYLKDGAVVAAATRACSMALGTVSRRSCRSSMGFG